MGRKHNPPLLQDIVPEFAVELAALLTAKGFESLAAEVPFAAVTGRCRCGDSFCATMHTYARPVDGLDGRHTLDFDTKQGLIIIDIWDGAMTKIEVLFRNDVRRRLLELFP